jgi:Tfp pilus assembly PilM family ATPase
VKKLLFLLTICFIFYIVYHDLTKGTLPVATSRPKENVPYKIVEVKAGDTILSIVEEEMNRSLPVPIDRLTKDFQSLNPGVKAESLQIGKKYRIPVYEK